MNAIVWTVEAVIGIFLLCLGPIGWLVILGILAVDALVILMFQKDAHHQEVIKAIKESGAK